MLFFKRDVFFFVFVCVFFCFLGFFECLFTRFFVCFCPFLGFFCFLGFYAFFCIFCFFGVFLMFFWVFRGPGAVKQEKTNRNTETNSKSTLFLVCVRQPGKHTVGGLTNFYFKFSRGASTKKASSARSAGSAAHAVGLPPAVCDVARG